LEILGKEYRDFRNLLWKHHREDKLRTVWEQYYGKAGDDELNHYDNETIEPHVLLQLLRTIEGGDWLSMRSCQHGDLHIGNVALDRDGGTFRAFIIDAGDLSPALCGRDLACLEVSLLLHQRYSADQGLVAACADLYNGNAPEGICEEAGGLSDHQCNTHTMLTAIRKLALRETTKRCYVLMLFDQVLIQLGSLAYGTANNKIYNAFDAIELYHYLSYWIGAEYKFLGNE
jgi:hypothetical protein